MHLSSTRVQRSPFLRISLFELALLMEMHCIMLQKVPRSCFDHFYNFAASPLKQILLKVAQMHLFSEHNSSRVPSSLDIGKSSTSSVNQWRSPLLERIFCCITVALVISYFFLKRCLSAKLRVINLFNLFVWTLECFTLCMLTKSHCLLL